MNIGESTISGTYILPKVIGKFNQRYPGIDIQLSISDTEDILKAIADGRIDIGIVGYPPGRHFYKKEIELDIIIVAVPSFCRIYKII